MLHTHEHTHIHTHTFAHTHTHRWGNVVDRKGAEATHDATRVGQAAAFQDDLRVRTLPGHAAFPNQRVDCVRQIIGKAAADATVAQGCHRNAVLERQDCAVDIHFSDVIDDDRNAADV